MCLRAEFQGQGRTKISLCTRLPTLGATFSVLNRASEAAVDQASGATVDQAVEEQHLQVMEAVSSGAFFAPHPSSSTRPALCVTMAIKYAMVRHAVDSEVVKLRKASQVKSSY